MNVCMKNRGAPLGLYGMIALDPPAMMKVSVEPAGDRCFTVKSGVLDVGAFSGACLRPSLCIMAHFVSTRGHFIQGFPPVLLVYDGGFILVPMVQSEKK